jgi:hypothetical protein
LFITRGRIQWHQWAGKISFENAGNMLLTNRGLKCASPGALFVRERRDIGLDTFPQRVE